jgi:hypothetical protein
MVRTSEKSNHEELKIDNVNGCPPQQMVHRTSTQAVYHLIYCEQYELYV